MPPVIRSQFGARVRVAVDTSKGLAPGEPVERTKQADKDACDVNKILERYSRTGQLPEMIGKNPIYGDFSNVPTYKEACEVVLKAQAQFEALSAVVRKQFDNDPAKMLAFCSDPKNQDEMIKLGLAVKKPEKPGAPNPPVPVAATTGATGGQPSGNTSTAPSGNAPQT